MYLINLRVYVLNVCTSIRTERFTNLSVLTINAFNVSKCFTFVLALCAYVLTCPHVSHASELYVSFLICFVLFFLLVIIYRHNLKPQTSLLVLSTHPIVCSKIKNSFLRIINNNKNTFFHFKAFSLHRIIYYLNSCFEQLEM